MKSDNEFVLESNHLRTRSSPWFLVQDNSLILSQQEEGIKLNFGSVLPKVNQSSFSLPKHINPPSLIFANPFLKAAKKIDAQTASIPWDQFSNTLKQSKSNIARLKEIYRPARSEANLKINKNYPIKKHFVHPQANYKVFTQKTSESPIKRHKNLSITLQNQGKIWTCLKTKSFASLSKTVHKFSESIDGKSQIFTVKNHFSEADAKPFRTSGLKKCRIKTKREISQSLPSTSDGASDGATTAPFAIVLKGNKIRSNLGTMFIPMSSGTFTPNHFMNNP